jgi:hypothetical protein
MSRQELIKRAVEHGITLNRTQGEKHMDIDDENIQVSRCRNSFARKKVHNNHAVNCSFYEMDRNLVSAERLCITCKHSFFLDLPNIPAAVTIYCLNSEARE